MQIAVASGKGGTGKTTVAVGMALSVAEPVCLLDCDVEEPNAHLLLHPNITQQEDVSVLIPMIDQIRCTRCGKCAALCEFNALVVLPSQVMVFADMCHSCGGCQLICPERAIAKRPNVIGAIESGHCGQVTFVQGILRVGHAMSPPVIRAVKHKMHADKLTILDCPPGSSCPFVTAVRGADVVLLVTEPTPFGLHDLRLTAEVVRELEIPCAVVLNRAGTGDDRVNRYCQEQGIPILLEIPDDQRIAQAYSRGQSLVQALPEYRELLAGLMRALQAMTAMQVPA